MVEYTDIGLPMSDLVRFESPDGIELFIRPNGEAYASVRGYVRMSGKAQSTISERVKGVRSGEILEAEVPTAGGLQGVRLIPAELVFKWLMGDNPELAYAMGKAGATLFLHQLAGFKLSSSPTEPPTLQLPPADVRVANLNHALEAVGIDLTNPRFSQHLKDLYLDILGAGKESDSVSIGAWVGVAERAEQLGYPVALVTLHRAKLGKWVARDSSLQRQQENRLCNGTQRPVWVYKVSPDLDRMIRGYFATLPS